MALTGILCSVLTYSSLIENAFSHEISLLNSPRTILAEILLLGLCIQSFSAAECDRVWGVLTYGIVSIMVPLSLCALTTPPVKL